MAKATAPSRPPGRQWLMLILLAGFALRLGYAVYEPTVKRFEDEKYAFENVHGIARLGTLRPVRYFYPSPVFNLPPAALVALSNALHRTTGEDRFLAIGEDGDVHAAAVLLCRLLMVAYGTVSVWFLFLIGRRLFSPGVGLMAAAMLALMPWMIHSSGVFKPDALLLMLILAAFYASLRAVADGRLLPYLLAGLTIALAMSSKLTGGLVAVPLVAATALSWRERRRWALLAAAGLASVIAFMLLNPYWRTYAHGLGSLSRDYAMRADWQLMTRRQIPGRVLDLLAGDTGHGPLIGALALAGLAGLAAIACRRSTAGRKRAELAMLLAFPTTYVAAYAVQTPYFKPNNFLPILPFTALAAAWLAAWLWRRAGTRWPPLASRLSGRLAGCALALLLVPASALYVYRSFVPTTEDLVFALLHKRFAPTKGRSAFFEKMPSVEPPWQGRRRFALAAVEVERLDAVAPSALNIADAEVFPERRLHGPAAEFYRGRVERLPADQVRFFHPRFLAARGPAMVALTHRRFLLEKVERLPLARCDAGPSCFQADLPAGLVAGERISLVLWASYEMVPRTESLPPVRLAGRDLELLQISGNVYGRHAATARLILGNPEEATLRFTADRPSRQPVAITLYRWAGGPRPAVSSSSRLPTMVVEPGRPSP